MGQTILTKEQREVIRVIAAEPAMRQYYLSGGTALATYYLKHRLSDDLDFFTSETQDAVFLHSFLGGECARVRRIEALPRLVRPFSLDELKTFFVDRAKELTPSIFE